MLRKYFLIGYILFSSGIFAQEISFNTFEDLVEYYSNRGYTLTDQNVIVLAVNYFLQSNSPEDIKDMTPLIMGNNPVYWYLYINLPPERDIPNILVAAFHKFNDIEYTFYKINENMETVAQQSFNIDGEYVRFKLFH